VRAVLAMPGCRGLAFDPARFQDFFARLESEGLRVFSWPTNSLARMVPACQEFYTAVLEHRITQDGNADLAAHIANAVLKEDRHGPRIVKESKSSNRKIDLAVCAVGAYAEARRLAQVPERTYFTALTDTTKPKEERTFEDELAELDAYFGDDDE
jgi:phage terminase large subunit-like protein